MMRYTILLLLLFSVGILRAQTQDDVTIFTAMGDEQARTKELMLPMANKPLRVVRSFDFPSVFSRGNFGFRVEFD